MRSRFLRSSHLLAAVAVAWAGGLAAGHLLVHHLAPNWTAADALVASLLLSVAAALVALLVIHRTVSGPTARLLGRVRRLRAGHAVGNLSGGLRGEALALARQFEEVLAHVEKLSQTDVLTSLSNRRSFQRVFLKEFRRARRYGRPLALAMVDIDFFKAANDALGHATGDAALKLCADVIARNVRASDAVARLGGDEFAVLMPETTAEEAVNVTERVRSAMAERTVGRGELKMTMTLSAGVTDLSAAGAETPEACLDLADQALYAAKRAGRNRTVRAEATLGAYDFAAGDRDSSRVDHLCRQLSRLDAKFKRLFVDAIGGLISALEARDRHTANHSAKVRRYATLIAAEMGLSERAVEHISRAAMLHDIGKIGLPDAVLLKEGALTEAEWELVRRHPVMSVRIMESMEFLDQEIPAVRYHHERFDGSGYPEGLSGSAIPLPSRVLAVADAFDAMTSSRTFRGGMPVAQALDELRSGSGTQFDPAAVEAFLRVVDAEGIDDASLETRFAAQSA